MTTLTAKEASKLIRNILKVDFKGTKFSVTIKCGNTCESVSITWLDGPGSAVVEEAIDEVKKKCWNDCYIFTSRTISPDLHGEFTAIVEKAGFTKGENYYGTFLIKLKRFHDGSTTVETYISV